jgi:hypothetical protein
MKDLNLKNYCKTKLFKIFFKMRFLNYKHNLNQLLNPKMSKKNSKFVLNFKIYQIKFKNN